MSQPDNLTSYAHLQREGVPQRRKEDARPDAPLEWEVPEQPRLLSEQQIRDIYTSLPDGPDLALRGARAIEDALMAILRPQLVELVEVARTVASVADALNFHPVADAWNPTALPIQPRDALHHTKPLVQAAQRLCARHGYQADGRPLAGNDPRQGNPEEVLQARERGVRDYTDCYRWLLAQAKLAGYPTVHSAILWAQRTAL